LATEAPPATRAARRVALAGVAAFVVLVAVEHPLRPDLPPGEHFVSEYAVGWTKPVQTVAFAAWAASMGACAVLAARARPPGRPVSRTVAVAALATAAAGGVLTVLFATQTVAGRLPAGVARTTAGRLHDFGTLLILAGLVAGALASLRLVRHRGYRVTVALLGVLLVAVVPLLVALRIDAPGLGQRAFILIGCAWQWRFASTARG
jgi:Protein of unknown function (DUF998)